MDTERFTAVDLAELELEPIEAYALEAVVGGRVDAGPKTADPKVTQAFQQCSQSFQQGCQSIAQGKQQSQQGMMQMLQQMRGGGGPSGGR
ncbi:MAG TPA: hypothetical protein VGL61_16365 [Kofleriaceae bacterium]|jgi:hypothetical protein